MKGRDGRDNSIFIKLFDEYGKQLRIGGQSIYFSNMFNDKN